MSDTLTQVEEVQVGSAPKYAHYVRADLVTDAYFFGKEVEALCGYRWVPTRDPDKYPVCPACVEIAFAHNA